MSSKAFHFFSQFHLSVMETMEVEAAKTAEASAIKPKQADWLLDEKLGLCIECECFAKAKKKMSLKNAAKWSKL